MLLSLLLGQLLISSSSVLYVIFIIKQNLLGLLEEIQDYTNGKSETPSPARPCCGFWDNGYQSIQLLNGDGSAELSPHNFVEQEVIEGCTVQVLRCRECGYESFAWFKPGKEVRT